MNLNFEVNNQNIKKVEVVDEENVQLLNYNYNQYYCNFRFNNDEDSLWKNIDKFAIFTDGWNNISIVHLGTEDVVECFVPSKVLNGSFFRVSIYGGDLVSTNNITVPLQMSGYINFSDEDYDNCNGYDGKDVFVEIFESLDSMITDVDYNINRGLDLFKNGELIDTIYIPFITEEDCNIIVRELLSDYGLFSSNDKERIEEELNNKINTSDISSVGLSGNYNDLINIPNEFEPSPHTHTSDDIEDLEENTSVEIKRAYNFLVNQIRRYGE